MAKAALKTLGLVVGAVVSVVLVLSAFYHWDFSGEGPLLTARFSFWVFFKQIPQHLHWMIPFMLLTAAIIPARALQWGATLPRRVPFRERYHLVAIGAFVHNALPGKLGDLTRSFLMSRTQEMSFVSTLGSVAVCKLLELAALMAIVTASLLGPFGQSVPKFVGAMKVAVAVCVALTVVVVVVAHYSGPLAARLKQQHRLPKVQHFLMHVSEGLGVARTFKGMMFALLLSIAPPLAASLAYGMGLSGVGVPGGIFAGAVVLGAISLGQGTPGIPAGTGIYYFITSWVARNLGATPENAAAFAALTHICTMGTFILVGAASVWIRKIRIRDLRKGSHEAADALNHVDDSTMPNAEPLRT